MNRQTVKEFLAWVEKCAGGIGDRTIALVNIDTGRNLLFQIGSPYELLYEEEWQDKQVWNYTYDTNNVILITVKEKGGILNE